MREIFSRKNLNEQDQASEKGMLNEYISTDKENIRMDANSLGQFNQTPNIPETQKLKQNNDQKIFKKEQIFKKKVFNNKCDSAKVFTNKKSQYYNLPGNRITTNHLEESLCENKSIDYEFSQTASECLSRNIENYYQNPYENFQLNKDGFKKNENQIDRDLYYDNEAQRITEMMKKTPQFIGLENNNNANNSRNSEAKDKDVQNSMGLCLMPISEHKACKFFC